MNNNPKRLLCIVGSMNAGGAETFLMKVYRTLDKNKYQMDFYVTTQEEGFYDKEIISMGGKIFYSIPKSKGFIKSFKTIKYIVRNEKYEHVLRVSQHSLSTLDLLAAKLGGAKTLIYRSSNTGTGGSRVNSALHKLFKWLPMTIPTVKIAPSTEAAEFMFGKNCVKNRKAIILKNAIAIDSFEYSRDRREVIREEFNINREFVIGHIGRFNYQKNHAFLLDVFAEIVRRHDNSILLLIGKGELESEIAKKVKNLGLGDKVIFTGIRSDIPDLLMAMDVFVFPSFFEGMPNTVIEAQATGLPCIISDKITKEANITSLVTYLSLNDSVLKWSKKALEYLDYKRESTRDLFIDNGYDIKSITEKIESLFFDLEDSI